MSEIVVVEVSAQTGIIEVVELSGQTGVVGVVETDFLLHNSSVDLQGGASGQYYHLTSGEYYNISGLIQNNLDPNEDVYFEKNVHVSGALLQGTGYNNYLTGLRTISDGKFSVNGDAQFSEFILKRQTTDASTYELQFTNTSKKLSLPDNTSWYFKLRVIAKDSSNNTAIFNIDGAIKKGASAGFTQIAGRSTVLNIVDEIGVGGISVSANTSYGYLQVDVVGKIATTIRWVAYLNLVEVK
jgi:hypothetical protein